MPYILHIPGERAGALRWTVHDKKQQTRDSDVPPFGAFSTKQRRLYYGYKKRYHR